MTDSTQEREGQFSAVCVYCGAKETTDEHIFGDWMKDLFPNYGRTIADVSNIERAAEGDLISETPSAYWRPKLNRNGSVHRAKLKIACRACNGGWMKTFQDNARPLLLELLRGNWTVASVEDLRHLARWATMVTMSSEYAHPASVVARPDERLFLKESLNPPPGWQAYVGLSVEDYHVGYWHRSLTGTQGRATSAVGKPSNLQVTFFTVGRAYFQVISGPDFCLPDPESWAFHYAMKQLLPFPDAVPPRGPLPLLPTALARTTSAYFAEAELDPRPHCGLIDLERSRFKR